MTGSPTIESTAAPTEDPTCPHCGAPASRFADYGFKLLCRDCMRELPKRELPKRSPEQPADTGGETRLTIAEAYARCGGAPFCAHCDGEDVDMGADVAVCRACNEPTTVNQIIVALRERRRAPASSSVRKPLLPGPRGTEGKGRSSSSDDKPGRAPNSEERPEPKLSQLVIETVCQHAELFHDPKDDAYACVRIGKRQEAMRLRSSKFRAWCARTLREKYGRPVGATAIEEALAVLEGIAICDRPEERVHIRVAERAGVVWIDLADDAGHVVRVTRDAWEVATSAPPVRFARRSAMRPLPMPERGGSIEALRPFLNVVDEDGFTLAVAWLVAAFRPERPFPVLNLVGEQGTGKSTASRVLRSLVDPSAAPVRSAPREEGDLFVAAVNSHVVAYDNLSGIPQWMSDALCRLATGGAISKRALYTNDEEAVLEAIRPLIVNGIDDLAARSDLADRSLLVALEPITPEKRRDEERFWSDFDAAAPRILGALLDGVVSALANVESVQLRDLPRMADFAKWSTAAEAGLGFPPGAVMAAYRRQRARAIEVALDASPVATAVRDLLADPRRQGRWEGTARQLMVELSEVVGDDVKRSRGWPKQPNHLARDLNRAKTFLREVGVNIDSRSEGRGTAKRRYLVLQLTRERGVQDHRPHRPSSTPANGSVSLGSVDEHRAIDPASTPNRPRARTGVGGVDDGGDGADAIDPENAHDLADGADGVDGADDSPHFSPGGGHAFSDLLEGE